MELYVKSFTVIAANKAITVTRVDTREILFVSQPLLKLLKLKNGNVKGKKLRDINQIAPYINEYDGLSKIVIQRSTVVNALIAHDFENTGIKSI